MHTERAGERRCAPRLKIFQPTLMRVASDVTRAHLLDVSAGGAQIHLRTPPEVGAVVHIALGGNQRPARVAWRLGKRVGVTFLAPLADIQVANILAEQQALVAQAAARIGPVG